MVSTLSAMAISVAHFLDVAEGVQAGQFTVGDHGTIRGLSDLDPIYKRLLDEPVTAIVSVTGSDGRPTSRRSGSTTTATSCC